VIFGLFLLQNLFVETQRVALWVTGNIVSLAFLS